MHEDADDCEQCTKILEELENIDDDCDRHGITFVKTKDFPVAEQYGVHEYPALVYFEGGIPNVFEGNGMRVCSVSKRVIESLKCFCIAG